MLFQEERMPTKGQRAKPSVPSPSLPWRGVVWTIIMAAAAYGIFFLHRRRIMTEEQLMLSIFVLVPISAFLLTGHGQDRSG